MADQLRNRHAKLAKVKSIQAKGLRHSHASFLINEYNANPLVIKDRLGHEDIKATLSTYSHLYPNVNFEIAKIMYGSINFTPSSTNTSRFNGNQHIKNKSKRAKVSLSSFLYADCGSAIEAFVGPATTSKGQNVLIS